MQQREIHKEIRVHHEEQANEGATRADTIGNFLDLLPGQSCQQDFDLAPLSVESLPESQLLRDENNEMFPHLRTALLSADVAANETRTSTALTKWRESSKSSCFDGNVHSENTKIKGIASIFGIDGVFWFLNSLF